VRTENCVGQGAPLRDTNLSQQSDCPHRSAALVTD